VWHSDRKPALQAQDPEFKPQPHQTKQNKTKKKKTKKTPYHFHVLLTGYLFDASDAGCCMFHTKLFRHGKTLMNQRGKTPDPTIENKISTIIQ
jgi:hypothetical protein